jgi:hypothetical protein
MKHLIFGILMGLIIILGSISIAEAHPHATVDLMESHSHDLHDEKFQENFLIHTFENVIFSIVDFFNSFLSR